MLHISLSSFALFFWLLSLRHEVICSSPAQLPALVALLQSGSGHVRGLAALVLGTCLLELPEANKRDIKKRVERVKCE